MKNKKPQPLLLKNFKWLSLALLIICLVFIYFIPRAIMYPNYSVIRWISSILIFFILPILVFATLILFTKQIKLSAGIAIASILIVGPTFDLFQNYREKVELNKYGVWIKSIVVHRKHLTNHRGGSWHWGIECRYEANARVYETLYHDDIDNLHPVGDTIKIIYSSRFPKIYSLGYEWEK